MLARCDDGLSGEERDARLGRLGLRGLEVGQKILTQLEAHCLYSRHGRVGYFFGLLVGNF